MSDLYLTVESKVGKRLSLAYEDESVEANDQSADLIQRCDIVDNVFSVRPQKQVVHYHLDRQQHEALRPLTRLLMTWNKTSCA